MIETPTDTELVLQVRHGNSDAFSILIRRYQARMRAFVAHYVANPDDVYDLVQDAFLEAFRHLETFDCDRGFLPWLRSICRHRVQNYFREVRIRRTAVESIVQEALLERLQQSEETPDRSLERMKALKSCIQKLRPQYRDLLHLRYTARVMVRDIAAQLGQTVGGTSMLLHRVRTLLRRCIEKELAGGDVQ